MAKTTAKGGSTKKVTPVKEKEIQVDPTPISPKAPDEDVVKEVVPTLDQIEEAKEEQKEELVDVMVTKETLEENPELVDEGIKEGEVIQVTLENDIYEEVSNHSEPVLVEVNKKDLAHVLEPDTIDPFDVFAKEEKGDKVWVKDFELLEKVEGRQFTLGGTLYYGNLKIQD